MEGNHQHDANIFSTVSIHSANSADTISSLSFYLQEANLFPADEYAFMVLRSLSIKSQEYGV